MLAFKSQQGRPSVGAIWLLTSLLTDSLKCGFRSSTCEGSGSLMSCQHIYGSGVKR